MNKLSYGHRERLRERFTKTGGAGISDYEFLEMLLYLAIPRKDTKPTAKLLIEKFKTLRSVLYANPNLLKSAYGIGSASIHVFSLVKECIIRSSREEISKTDLISSFDKVVNYCQMSMGCLPREQLKILFLDNKNYLISDETLQEGTINSTALYPREILKRAFDNAAASMIIVHNHPSGDPTPSARDIEITKILIEIGKQVCLKVHDHIIIGRQKYKSLKRLGLMD
ncbi:MAG: DNA repair protein RadC [Holosporales bacterium]|jgi:DNA repair protein RadC|nr:DNA repair protein RadC [Holosporales bacterium]